MPTQEPRLAISNWTRRGGEEPARQHVSAEAIDVLGWLTPDLKATLASLDGAPPELATAVVQLLPFALRAVMVERGMAVAPQEDAPCAVATLTPLAFQVIRAAALDASANPGVVADWLRRAEEAARDDAIDK